VGARIHAELLVVEGDGPAAWRFSGSLLRRVQHMQHMERNFDATPELAALVADLSDEIEALLQRLRRAGLG
jgi:chaperone modulatory protein CbpM